MNRAAERPDDGRKTVLIVEDDPGTQRVLASGLATSLGMFDVLTANHGQEAVELLESRPIDVVVTDLAMPVMDGFALIGYLTNRGTTIPVVVLSALAPSTVAEGLDGYGGLTVLRKPTGYPEVARAVLDALERHDLGQVAGIPLASVLQLVEAERRTCSLGVTSGRRRGRLHFESGRLINAFSDDFGAEGEAAAYDILTWTRTAIEFQRLPEGVRRTIDMPTQMLLIEVARRQDAQREREAKLTPPAPLPHASNGPLGAPEPVVDPGVAPDAPPVAADPDPAARSDAHAEPELAPAPEAAHANAREPEPAPVPAWVDAPAGSPLHAPHLAPHLAADPAPDVAPDLTPDLAPDAARDLAPDPASAPVLHPHVDEAEPARALGAGGTGYETVHAGASAPTGDAPIAPPPASTVEPPNPVPPAPRGRDAHAELITAIDRLTHRVQEADEALAAVATEVDAFRAAQQRYDDEVRRQEERRRAVEAARRDVADLARQILERMDVLFETFETGAPVPPGAARAGTSPSDA